MNTVFMIYSKKNVPMAYFFTSNGVVDKDGNYVDFSAAYIDAVEKGFHIERIETMIAPKRKYRRYTTTRPRRWLQYRTEWNKLMEEEGVA